MRTILAFAYTVFIVVIVTPIGLAAFVLSFLGLKKPMTWVVYKIAQFWALTLIAMTGCSLEVEGKEHIPAKGGVCFVSNHVGMFDILLALALIGRPFGFVAKKELLALPLINIWIYILGGLFIDRKNIRKAVRTINAGILRLQKGGGMLIFPEGTRSKGRGLLPFKSGAVKLATNSLVPIVPVAIAGSYDVFEKNRRIRRVPVRVVFCPPIITSGMSPDDRRHKLADNARDIIAAALEKKGEA